MKSVLLALLLCSVGTVCQAQDAIVRSHVEPQAGAVVGQHMRIMIDVLFKNQMPRPPRVTIAETPGAQILRLETQATTINDTIDGQSYVGQRFEFALYPRRSGTITVPPASITLLDANGDEVGTLKGQKLQTEVVVPKGVDPSAPVVATVKATLEEQWSPVPTTSFKTGDALVRTVTRTAADVPAMAMLDLAFPAPNGARVYVDPPQGEDSVDRGDLTGRRVDRVTYVFESAGTFEIPAVVQPWWDLDDSRLRQAQGAGTTVKVAAIGQARRWWEIAMIPAGTAIVILGFGWWLVPRLRGIWIERRRQWLQSEVKAFRDLLSTCGHTDAATTYRAFKVWERRLGQRQALLPLSVELEETLFGAAASESWTTARSAAFARKCRSMRQHIRQEHNRRRAHSALPPLNAPLGDVHDRGLAALRSPSYFRSAGPSHGRADTRRFRRKRSRNARTG